VVAFDPQIDTVQSGVEFVTHATVSQDLKYVTITPSRRSRNCSRSKPLPRQHPIRLVGGKGLSVELAGHWRLGASRGRWRERIVFGFDPRQAPLPIKWIARPRRGF